MTRPRTHRHPEDAAGDELAVLTLSQRGSARAGEHVGLPVRSPGAYLHPLLRRPPGAGHLGSAGSSA